MERIHLPRLKHCLVIPLGITVASGLPFARTTLSVLGFAVLLVLLVFLFQRFLQAKEDDSFFYCRSPETFQKVVIPKLGLISEDGRFPLGGVPGRVIRSASEKDKGFIPQ